MTGFLGGGHGAICGTARGRATSTASSRCPRAAASSSTSRSSSASRSCHYSVGPASCAVPGVPAGLDALCQAGGGCPGAARRARAPARPRGRRAAARRTRAASRCSRVMTPSRGAAIYAPGGPAARRRRPPRPARPGRGDRSARRRGRADRLSAARSPRRCSTVEGVAFTRDDLRRYEALWREPVSVDLRTVRPCSPAPAFRRAGAARADPRSARTLGDRARARASSPRSTAGRRERAHTTNLVALDADGRACVLTTSLGVGAGDWVARLRPPPEHMLGETDLARRRRSSRASGWRA